MAKVIGLIGQEGYNEAPKLFITDREDEENFQEVFDECERLAEMAAEQWADGDVPENERDDVFTAYENYLSEQGFTRVYSIETTTNLY